MIRPCFLVVFGSSNFNNELCVFLSWLAGNVRRHCFLVISLLNVTLDSIYPQVGQSPWLKAFLEVGGSQCDNITAAGKGL